MSARRGLPTAVKMRHDVHYVDSLLFKEGEVIGRKVALDLIRPNPNQPRKEMGEIDQLADSVREHGVLEPILVIQEEGVYRIVSGERRYLAARQAGLDEMPCIVKNLNAQQIVEVALVDSIQRKDHNPLEEADGLQVLFEEFGYTHDQLARKIGKSRSSVSETLSIAQLSDRVRRAAVAAGVLAKSVLVDIAKLHAEPAQLKMIEKLGKGATRSDLRQETRKPKRARPFVFKFRDPGKTYQFQLKFKRSEVSHSELIETLEQVIQSLRDEQD